MKSTITKLLLSTISVVAMGAAAQAADPAPAGAISNILDGAAPGTVTVAGITVYGTFDVGMVYNSHTSNRDTLGSSYIQQPYVIFKGSQRSNFTYQDNALSQSNIGVRGNQSLKDLLGSEAFKGWSVGFDAQVNFDPLYGELADTCKTLTKNNFSLPANQQIFAADGSRCGQLFGGDAFASLKNDVLGELRFGRQLNPLGSTIAAADPNAGSYSLSLLAFSGTYGSGGGITEQGRWNNAIKYSNTIGPVRVGAAYRFDGGGQGGDGWGFNAGIDVPGALKGLSIDGAYIKENAAITSGSASNNQCIANGFANAAACENSNLLAGTVSDNEAWTVTAKYKFDDASFAKGLTVMGGYERIAFNNSSSLLSNKNTIGGYTLSSVAGANGINYTAYGTERDLDVYWIGGKYAFNPKLTGSAGWYHVTQGSYSAGGGTNTLTSGALTPCSGVAPSTIKSNCGGNLNFYSVGLDYQVTKRMDLYAGASWSDVSGGLSAGFLATSEYNLVSGVRFRC